MTFGVSPGVYTNEVDISTIVPAASATVGAFVGNFKWGPVEQTVLNTSELDLINNYTIPDIDTQVDFHTAASYLGYSNSLQIVRAYDPAALNATTADAATPGPGFGFLVKNANDYTTKIIPDSIDWIAKYPGVLGNSLAVVVVPSKTAVTTDLPAKIGSATSKQDKTMYGQIQSVIGLQYPTTTDYTLGKGASNDEIHVFVVDYQGKFSGVAGTVLESYIGVSMALDAKSASGVSNYYVDVVNQSSKYIWWGSHPSVLGIYAGTVVVPNVDYKTGTTLTTVIVQTFGGGSDGTYPLDDAAYIAAQSFFKSKDTIKISFIIMGARSSVPTLDAIQNIAEVRKDCVVFASPTITDVVNAANPATNCITYRDSTLTSPTTTRTDTLAGYSSTYAFLDCNWKYMYNKYSNNFIWVPLNGDTAGLAAATDQSRAQWYSFAGYNRGIVKNAVKLAWNPNEAERDMLYSAQINPVVSVPGKGIVLFGDKTMTTKPSAFDRINVRRLFIVLETAIGDAAQYSLFEFNDQFTRALFVSIVDPFLRDVKGRRGLTDYYIVCDDRNNTPQVIDSNQFVASIYIKPARSINYIKLDFVAVGTSVEFSTVVGAAL